MTEQYIIKKIWSSFSDTKNEHEDKVSYFISEVDEVLTFGESVCRAKHFDTFHDVSMQFDSFSNYDTLKGSKVRFQIGKVFMI